MAISIVRTDLPMKNAWLCMALGVYNQVNPPSESLEHRPAVAGFPTFQATQNEFPAA